VNTATQTTEMPKRRSFWSDVLIRLIREKPLGTVGMVIVLILFITGIFANYLAPYPPNEVNVAELMVPPSPNHILGTDNLGRDILSRIIYGARISMIVGLTATAIHTVLSTAIGMASGFIGGTFDLLVQRFIDAWICFPPLIILISLRTVVGAGMLQLILILGVVNGISAVRFKRSLVLAVRENMYVQASKALGAKTSAVLWRHLLPNILPMIIVLFSMTMGGIILAEASLSFLGLGLPLSLPSWGGMISGPGRSYMLRDPWLAMWPGIALSLAVFGINMLGDALRDLLDPRLRGGVGGYSLDMAEKARVKVQKKLKESRVR